LKHSKEYPEIRRLLLSRGLFSRVAKDLNLSVSHVIRVAKGESQSKRVLDAIVLEARRIERQTERAA
jgi:hypothetical protein